MKEKDIERKVCEYAKKTYGMLTYKFNSVNHRGVPDRIFITRQGVIAFIEFKAPGKAAELTALQWRTAIELDEHCCDVFVVDDVDSGKRLVDAMSDPDTWLIALGYKEPEDDTPKLVLPSRLSETRH